MAQARHGHAAVLLADGQVLVVGGHDAAGRATATAEIFDPARAAWRPAGTLRFARYGHTATRLADGRVLVVGGYDGVTYGLDVAEVLDPAHGAWTTAAPSERGWVYHTATLLQDGRVLLAGGHLPGYVPVPSASLYDPHDDTWAVVDEMISPRGRHSATLLADGRVLVAGGYQDLALAELFAPPVRRDHHVFLPSALRPGSLAPELITDTPRRDRQPAGGRLVAAAPRSLETSAAPATAGAHQPAAVFASSR
jgi:hypothetical protein